MENQINSNKYNKELQVSWCKNVKAINPYYNITKQIKKQLLSKRLNNNNKKKTSRVSHQTIKTLKVRKDQINITDNLQQ